MAVAAVSDSRLDDDQDRELPGAIVEDETERPEERGRRLPVERPCRGVPAGPDRERTRLPVDQLIRRLEPARRAQLDALPLLHPDDPFAGRVAFDDFRQTVVTAGQEHDWFDACGLRF